MATLKIMAGDIRHDPSHAFGEGPMSLQDYPISLKFPKNIVFTKLIISEISSGAEKLAIIIDISYILENRGLISEVSSRHLKEVVVAEMRPALGLGATRYYSSTLL